MKATARYWLTPSGEWQGDKRILYRPDVDVCGRVRVEAGDTIVVGMLVDIEPTPDGADSYLHAYGAHLVVGEALEADFG